MSRNKLYVTFGLIAIFVAFTVTPPRVAQTQSGCSPDQRKEFVLTAVGQDGNVVDKLQPAQLSLKVGGAPATISDIVWHAKTPLDIAVLIDASVSQEGILPAAKASARAFVTSVATPGQDRVAVVSFSDKPHYLRDLTSDLSGVAAAIDQIQLDKPEGYVGGGVVVSTTGPPTAPLAGGTSLWDVIREATIDLFGEAEKRRRVMLLFTDGIDTSSSEKFSVIVEEALRSDVAVFAIGVTGSNYAVDQGPLKKLTEQTGGVAEFPGKKKEKLEAALTQIARHLRGNYVVGYCGGGTKDRGKLQLEVVDPEMRKAKPVMAYKRY